MTSIHSVFEQKWRILSLCPIPLLCRISSNIRLAKFQFFKTWMEQIDVTGICVDMENLWYIYWVVSLAFSVFIYIYKGRFALIRSFESLFRCFITFEMTPRTTKMLSAPTRSLETRVEDTYFKVWRKTFSDVFYKSF